MVGLYRSVVACTEKRRKMQMMTVLTIELPDEANEIADLPDRLKWFVDEQLKVERWRKKKYSAEVHLIAEEARLQAEKIQQEGMNRDEVAENFLKLWDEVADSIEE